jgi:hypothetical protein
MMGLPPPEGNNKDFSINPSANPVTFNPFTLIRRICRRLFRMGLLTPEGDRRIVKRSVPVTQAKQSQPVELAKPDSYQSCDKCGHSHVDNQPISRAKVEVYLGKGSVFLCGHHFRINLSHFLEHGYYFRTLKYEAVK